MPISGLRVAFPILGLCPALLGCAPEESEPQTEDPLEGCEWGSETGGDFGGLERARENDDDFARYMKAHVQQLDRGWQIEGDMVGEEIADVYAAYRHYQASTSTPSSKHTRQQDSRFRSTVYCDFLTGTDRILDPAEKLALTYCFDRSWDDFPVQRSMTIEAVRSASLAWESAADVNFIAVQDGEACSSDSALIPIQYEADCEGNDPCKISGRASFPHSTNRRIQFFPPAYLSMEKLEFTATHELGHIFGLFHEHSRVPQVTGGLCSASSGATAQGPSPVVRGVTEFDPLSVMGYPQCSQTTPTPPYPSPLDRAGLAYLYNLPRPMWGGISPAPDSGTIVWHQPTTGEYFVWEPSLGSDQDIEFTETSNCYYNDCSVGATPHWKPILLQSDTSVDVLMYGPGQFEERRFLELDGTVSADNPATLTTNNDIPVLLDDFFSPDESSIWWIRASFVDDQIWRSVDENIVSTQQYDDRPWTDDHFSASAGHALLGQTTLFWLSPTDPNAYLTWFAGGSIQHISINKTQCGLTDEVTYNGIPGNYDGDTLDELAWYDFDSGEVVYWPQLPGCGAHTTFNVGQAKVASLRLLNEDREFLMVYKPQLGTVEFYDVSISAPATPPLVISGDASPILRDFDQDGCTDILWFTPHLATSPLWRSNCDATFDQTVVSPPSATYPLGYGLGHGRG